MKRISRRKFTELLALGTLAGCAAPPAPKQQPVDWTLYSPDRYGAPTDAIIPWRLVAVADLIVRGTITVSSEAELTLAQSTNNGVMLPLSVSQFFKGGTARRSLKLNYWPGQLGEPLPASIVTASGRELVAFLVLSDEDENADGPCYFARHDSSALFPASATVEQALTASIARQSVLASQVADYLAVQSPPFDEYVGGLTEKLLAESTAFDSAQELLSLGPAHAAALVKHMDGRRQIAVGRNGVMAPSSDDQAPRSYWPKAVVDLVSLALQHATDNRMGATANGGSERARRRVVDAWRLWLGRSLRLKAG